MFAYNKYILNNHNIIDIIAIGICIYVDIDPAYAKNTVSFSKDAHLKLLQ